MKWSISKKYRIILGCVIAVILLVGINFAYMMNFLSSMGNTKIPNMTIKMKNDSDIDICYSVLVEGRNPESGEIGKNKKSTIKVVYPWNLTDQLKIIINDKDGNLLCESRPNLNIKRQHLFNPNIKYQLDVVYKNSKLYIEQVK